MSEILDREALMACTTPAELFGDALADGKALRRAYARLAKAYRAETDPEAFQHLRALYEEARARPAAASQGGPATEKAPKHPVDLVAEALNEGELGVLFDRVVEHHRVCAAEAPGLLHQCVEVLFLYAGPHFSPGALDMLETVVEDPAWDVDPRQIEGWAVQIGDLRELWRAAEDEAIPPALIAGVRRAWREAPHVAAAVWAAVGKELEDVELEPIFEHLVAEHPAVYALIKRSELQMHELARTGDEPDSFPELVEVTSILTSTPGARPTVANVSALVSVVLLTGLAVVLVTLIGFEPPPPTTIDDVVAWIGTVGLAAGAFVVAVTMIRQQNQHRNLAHNVRQRLGALCREHGLFPRELAALIVARGRPTAVVHGQHHPLYRFDRWESGTLATIGEAHVQRLTAIAERLTQEEAENG